MSGTYRGSPKHKARPSRGRKGTLCPEWTHATAKGLADNVLDHHWEQTEAHCLFAASEPCPEGSGKKFATKNGIAFVAVSTGDGSWHGYPVPWQDVPGEIIDRWREQGMVKRRDLIRYMERDRKDIRWALETDDEA